MLNTQWFERGILPDFPAKRWLKIFLRTLHIASVCAVTGLVLVQQPHSQAWLFWSLAMSSGLLLLLIDVLSNFLWLVQMRGLLIFIKLLLLALMPFVSGYDQWLILFALCISAFISHAPSDVRYYSWLHGRKITSKKDSKG